MAAAFPSTCASCTNAATSAAGECPPRMADGRLFTDYRPRCDRNLAYAAPMTGSWDYRQFLIGNGDRIIDVDRTRLERVARCAPCVPGHGTMAPEADRVVCDKVSCTRIQPGKPNPFAIGTGREYGFVLDEARSAPGAASMSAAGPARWGVHG